MHALKLVVITSKMKEITTLSGGMAVNYHTAKRYVSSSAMPASIILHCTHKLKEEQEEDRIHV